MTYLFVQAALSGTLISVFAVIWLWRDTGGDVVQITTHARATLWYMLPGLPFFLVLPAFLQRAVNFWGSLALSATLIVLLYLVSVWAAGRFNINFD